MKNKKRFRLLSLLLVMLLLVSCATPSNKVEQKPEETQIVEEEVNEPSKDFNQDRSATGKNGGVASGKPWSSDIGVQILEQGGNAVDAAVATAFALGAYEPQASGIGGGGLMLIHLADGTETFIEFREMAPSNAKDDMFPLDEEGKVIDKLNSRGGLAVGIPGDVEGLLYALEKYGTMTPEQVLRPTIDACREGIPVTGGLASAISDKFNDFEKWESIRDVYFDSETGLPFVEGDTIINDQLAETLEKIASEGRDGFYKGEVAQAIVDEVNRTGGVITMEDMANYRANERPIVKGTYRGYDILTITPPSSGGAAVIQLLNIMENVDLPNMEYNSPETVNYWAEAMKRAFADRAKYMGDPDYVEIPTEGLINKDYAKELFDSITPGKPTPNVVEGDPWKYNSTTTAKNLNNVLPMAGSSEFIENLASNNTTHLSVMDNGGNVVSLTRTVNDYFGSCVMAPGTGVVLNNEMLDFDAEPGRANSVAPGKRPLSSMTPTIVLKDGEPILAIGSPGGMRIITHVATTISKILDHKMPLQEAINSPRIYMTHESDLWMEEFRYPDETVKALQDMGYEFNMIDWSGSVTAVELIDGVFVSAGDSRIEGQGSAY